MPTSRTNKNRRDKVARYAAKDADYQRKLKQFQHEKALGYKYPEYPPSRTR